MISVIGSPCTITVSWVPSHLYSELVIGSLRRDYKASPEPSRDPDLKIVVRVIFTLSISLSLSSKKVDFLRVCGLTTLAHRDELLARKRRKRRRMLRERSLSPPAVRGKRKASSPPTPATPLTTPYSAEQMDSTPELEEKKDFLHMFDLSHVSPQQRRGNNLFQIHTRTHTHTSYVLLCSLHGCSGNSPWKSATCSFSLCFIIY